MKTGIIIQARSMSTRFPQKILKPLPYDSSLTVLDQVIRRVKLTKSVDEIIIATTLNSEDDEIAKTAKRNEVQVFRGSEIDVLDRYYNAAISRELDIIVRLTSDCPCIDWNIIDNMVKEFKTGEYDYLSNTLKRTFPHGLDVEVFSSNALIESFEKAEGQEFREHVTSYMYTSNKFKTGNFQASPSCFAPGIRITLDTLEDYALICAVYHFLYDNNPNFYCYDIVKLFNENKWLFLINKNVVHKKIFQTLDEEVKEATRILELNDLNKAVKLLSKELSKYPK
jgi:spore coat polysaccharide biosynthesis protein SpsF